MIAVGALAVALLAQEAGGDPELSSERLGGTELPHPVAVELGRLWGDGAVTVDGRGTVVVHGSDGTTAATFELGRPARDLAVAGEDLWLLTHAGRLERRALPSGELELELPSTAHRLALSPDGTRLAVAGGPDELVRWLSPEDGSELAQLSLPAAAPIGVTFAPGSGELLLVVVDQEKLNRRPKAQERPLSRILACSADSEAPRELAAFDDVQLTAGPLVVGQGAQVRVLAGDRTGRVHALEVSERGEVDTVEAAPGGVVGLWHAGPRALISDGASLFAGDLAQGPPSTWSTVAALHGIRLLDVDEKERLLASLSRHASVLDVEGLRSGFPGHAAPVSDLRPHPAGHRLLSSSYDGTVLEWDLGGGAVRARNAAHDGWVHAACWIDGDVASASVGRDGTLRLWTPDAKPVTRSLLQLTAPVTDLDHDPATARLALAATDRSLRVVALEGEGVGELFAANMGPGVVYACRFVAGGERVVTAGNTLRLFDVESGELVAEQPSLGAPITALAAIGDRLAVGLANRHAHVFDVAEGDFRALGSTGPWSTRVGAVALGDGGRRLALADGPSAVLVDVASMQEVARSGTAGSPSPITALAFSADASELYVGYQDGDLQRVELGERP